MVALQGLSAVDFWRVMKKVLVTGGAGFIGSALVRYLIEETDDVVLNVDKLTYAGHQASLLPVASSDRYSFVQLDIGDSQGITAAVADFEPDIIFNLAAESHVDRSIDGPGEFIKTNVVGTYNMLEVTREYWSGLSEGKAKSFRFHHISTDEVFGELGASGFFTEQTSYSPRSPYSASKASSDHLVRAWFHTYGLPVLVTNCSNNYGPYHFPEKLVPLIILNALSGKSLPIYGDGQQIRDWLFVEDHVRALYRVAANGVVGETYNIGGNNEKTNLQVVEIICELLEELAPEKPSGVHFYRDLITFVKDRPGHDQRYAIDASKMLRDLHWQPEETFESGIKKTVQWYLANQSWCETVQKDNYQRSRLGLSEE